MMQIERRGHGRNQNPRFNENVFAVKHDNIHFEAGDVYLSKPVNGYGMILFFQVQKPLILLSLCWSWYSLHAFFCKKT